MNQLFTAADISLSRRLEGSRSTVKSFKVFPHEEDEGYSFYQSDYEVILAKATLVKAYTTEEGNSFVLNRNPGDPRSFPAMKTLREVGVSPEQMRCDTHDRFGYW